MSEKKPTESIWAYQKRLKKEEAIKVYDQDGITVIKPLSGEACSLYGNQTKWCVCGRRAAQNWSNHIAKNVCFYIVINKNLDKNDLLYKVLAEVADDGSVIWWDVLNNQIEKPFFIDAPTHRNN